MAHDCCLSCNLQTCGRFAHWVSTSAFLSRTCYPQKMCVSLCATWALKQSWRSSNFQQHVLPSQRQMSEHTCTPSVTELSRTATPHEIKQAISSSAIQKHLIHNDDLYELMTYGDALPVKSIGAGNWSDGSDAAPPRANMTCATYSREISEQRGRYEDQRSSQGHDEH